MRLRHTLTEKKQAPVHLITDIFKHTLQNQQAHFIAINPFKNTSKLLNKTLKQKI
jgi:hypothetical protein